MAQVNLKTRLLYLSSDILKTQQTSTLWLAMVQKMEHFLNYKTIFGISSFVLLCFMLSLGVSACLLPLQYNHGIVLLLLARVKRPTRMWSCWCWPHRAFQFNMNQMPDSQAVSDLVATKKSTQFCFKKSMIIELNNPLYIEIEINYYALQIDAPIA